MATLYFLEELLLEVLSRLPSKTVLRFVGVSKKWKNLIENRYFTKMHLNQLENNNSNSNFIVCCHDNGRSKLYATSDDTSSAKELHYPPLRYKERGGIELVGSSNGVLCLQFAYRKIILWNPLSHTYQEVPRPRRIFGTSTVQSRRCCAYGFGYDKSSDDYKLVSLVAFYDIIGSLISSKCWIYSLKLKRWKKLEKFSYTLSLSQNGVLVNGRLHWISSDNLILVFNLADEKFYTLPQPNYSKDISSLNVGTLDGYLNLTCKARGSRVFETWEMKDYGIKDSWIKINLDSPQGQRYHSLRPIKNLNRKQRVFIRDSLNKLFLYDVEKKSVQRVSRDDNWGIHPYLETLECYNFTSNETARNRRRRKKARGTNSDSTSCFMDKESEHHWKRIKR